MDAAGNSRPGVGSVKITNRGGGHGKGIIGARTDMR